LAKKKRRKHRKKRIVSSPPPQREDLLRKENESDSVSPPLRKKTVLILIPLVIVIAAALVIFLFLRRGDKIQRNSDLNVLLVTLDTTRADRIGCYGHERAKTPSLDSLAAAGVRFSKAYCQVPLTLPSHCSLLTSSYPLSHNVHNNGSYSLASDSTTLAEILQERGYRTAAFVSSFTVDSRFGLDQGFEVYDDTFKEDEIIKHYRSERRAETVFTSFSKWLDANNEQKFFCWVHFFDPHIPYEPPPPFKEEFASDPYDGEIAYMDLFIGKTIERLNDKNLLDSTLIILVGDHGEALGEKGEKDHGVFIYDNTLKVPFIMHNKSILPAGEVVSPRVRVIDIMPTILDILNVPLPESLQGTSLIPYIERKRKDDLPSYVETYYPKENYGWSELTGWIDREWKFIQAPKEELYNLKTDPSEETNLIYQERETAQQMKKNLSDLIKDHSVETGTGRRTLTSEEEERLRALGYVGGGFSEDALKGDLPDPKDRIEEFQIIFQAKMYEFQQNYSKAIESYKKIIALEPKMPVNYNYLASIYIKTKRLEEAAEILRQGINNTTDPYRLLSRLAIVYAQQGKLKEALEANEAALLIKPDYFDALLSLGGIKSRMGNYEQALSFYTKALDIEPENRFVRLDYAHALAGAGRTEEALSIYSRLESAFPEDSRIQEDLGIFYASQGKLQTALAHFKKAVDLKPSPPTYLNYAVMLEKVGNLEDAVRYLRLYLETTTEQNTPRKLNAQRVLAQWERRLK
jgi:arylsulfatase A-like enzyme/tetratricopeptide (TPR) repeat protein